MVRAAISTQKGVRKTYIFFANLLKRVRKEKKQFSSANKIALTFHTNKKKIYIYIGSCAPNFVQNIAVKDFY